jgi:putative ABC transport system substrate-binding protein
LATDVRIRQEEIESPFTDPVGRGFVASLAHPGGTITGFSDFDPPIARKWPGMLTQITPPVARARVAVLYNPATAPQAGLMLRAIEDTAPSLAVAVRAASAQDDSGIEAMMAGLARGELVLAEIFTFVHRARYHRLCCIGYPLNRNCGE